MPRAQGGDLCFAKEAVIMGQSDYLCVSADPLCPFPPFFFLFPSNRPATLNIMSVVWNTLTKKPHSFVPYRKRDGRSLTAKKLKGFCQIRRGGAGDC